MNTDTERQAVFAKLLALHKTIGRLQEELGKATDEYAMASEKAFRQEDYGLYVFEGVVFELEPDAQLVTIRQDVKFPADE